MIIGFSNMKAIWDLVKNSLRENGKIIRDLGCGLLLRNHTVKWKRNETVSGKGCGIKRFFLFLFYIITELKAYLYSEEKDSIEMESLMMKERFGDLR